MPHRQPLKQKREAPTPPALRAGSFQPLPYFKRRQRRGVSRRVHARGARYYACIKASLPCDCPAGAACYASAAGADVHEPNLTTCAKADTVGFMQKGGLKFPYPFMDEGCNIIVIYVSAIIGLRNVPMPWISISHTSPGFILRGAPSVPIQITSPGYSVQYLLMASI